MLGGISVAHRPIDSPHIVELYQVIPPINELQASDRGAGSTGKVREDHRGQNSRRQRRDAELGVR